jgi:hypothetical protein
MSENTDEPKYFTGTDHFAVQATMAQYLAAQQKEAQQPAPSVKKAPAGITTVAPLGKR